MTRISTLEHEFVDALPDELAEGVLYISLPFTTVSHLCCCGCGNQVFTPLRPNRWRLTFDGEMISLYPSVGNWNFPCESHYWITGSRVRWAPAMTRREIELMRENARAGKGAVESWEQKAARGRSGAEGDRRTRRLLRRLFTRRQK